MACLHDHRVFAVMGMGTVSVNGDNAAHSAVVKGEGAEMLCQQDNGPALIFIGAEGPGRHDHTFAKSEGHAEIVQFGHKLGIGNSKMIYFKGSKTANNFRLDIGMRHVDSTVNEK